MAVYERVGLVTPIRNLDANGGSSVRAGIKDAAPQDGTYRSVPPTWQFRSLQAQNNQSAYRSAYRSLIAQASNMTRIDGQISAASDNFVGRFQTFYLNLQGLSARLLRS